MFVIAAKKLEGQGDKEQLGMRAGGLLHNSNRLINIAVKEVARGDHGVNSRGIIRASFPIDIVRVTALRVSPAANLETQLALEGLAGRDANKVRQTSLFAVLSNDSFPLRCVGHGRTRGQTSCWCFSCVRVQRVIISA